jgi:hypothetical protein
VPWIGLTFNLPSRSGPKCNIKNEMIDPQEYSYAFKKMVAFTSKKTSLDAINKRGSGTKDRTWV